MIDFISNMINKEKAKEETAQDRLYRLTPISTVDKLSAIVERFAKTKRSWMPVVDANNVCVGILEQVDLIQLIAKNKLSTTLAKTNAQYNKKISYIDKAEPIKGLIDIKPDCVVYGKNGKYAGVIRW